MSNQYSKRMKILDLLRHHHQVAWISRRPDPLDLNAARAQTGMSLLAIQGVIADLLLLGYVKPTIGQPDHLAVEGFCQITAKGMEALDEFEAMTYQPEFKSKPVGFGLGHGK